MVLQPAPTGLWIGPLVRLDLEILHVRFKRKVSVEVRENSLSIRSKSGVLGSHYQV